MLTVIDEDKRLETHGGVLIFRIIFGIQVESLCLATYILLNIDITDSLLIKHAVSHTISYVGNQLLLTSKEGGSLQAVI